MNGAFASCAAGSFLVVQRANSVLAQASGEKTRDESASGVPYLSGGVGESGREDVEAAAKDYNSKFVLAGSGGVLVADVNAYFLGSRGGTVLDTTSEGPLFFARLPAGNYSVEATYQGIAKQSPVSIAATGQRVLDLLW